MLFMTIFTWDPERSDEVSKRRATEKVTEGIRIVGEWVDLQGGRVFRLSETDDPKAFLAESFAWSDLGWIESAPVMESEEVMKLLPKG